MPLLEDYSVLQYNNTRQNTQLLVLTAVATFMLKLKKYFKCKIHLQNIERYLTINIEY